MAVSAHLHGGWHIWTISAMDHCSGEIIDDCYQLLEPLGRGGMGVVYRARDVRLGRKVAIKMILPEMVGDAEARMRFKQEGKILSHLHHECLPAIYRFGIWGNQPYIAMEFITGHSLRDELDKQRLSVARALSIGLHICEAMQEAHTSNILHRDLKPSNIMLTESADSETSDKLKILDFGLARILNAEKCTADLTKSGMLIGTTFYMSPEQCMGQAVDQRSDIYAVGCILYEMLSGEPPFCSDSPIAVLQKHMSEPVPALQSKMAERLPPGLENVIIKALAKDTSLRYQTMGELAQDLSLISMARGEEITPLIEQSTKRGMLRNRALLITVASLAGVTLISCILYGLNRPAPTLTPKQQLTAPKPLSSNSDDPKTLLINATALCEQTTKPSEHALDDCEQSMALATKALAQVPENENGLRFQAHLVLSDICAKTRWVRRELQIKERGVNKELKQRRESEVFEALQCAQKPDGGYYQAAVTAYVRLARIANERNDDESRKSYDEKALKILEQKNDYADFPTDSRLPGHLSPQAGVQLKQDLAQTAMKRLDYKSAQHWLCEALFDSRLDGCLTDESIACMLDLSRLYQDGGEQDELTKLESSLDAEINDQLNKGRLTPNRALAYRFDLSLIAIRAGHTARAVHICEDTLKKMSTTSPPELFFLCDFALKGLSEAARLNPSITPAIERMKTELRALAKNSSN